MMRRALAIGLAALAALGAGAVRAADGPRLVNPGELTWGASTTFAPFEFQKDGQTVGFDVDMVAELGKRIGAKSTLLSMDFAGIVPALASGKRIDLAVSGMYVTPARLEVVDFIPYMLIGNQIVAPAANPGRLTGKDALCGHTIAVATNTSFESSLKALSAACKAAGQREIEILSLGTSATVSLALAQGRAEGALSSTATIASMMTTNPGTFAPVGEPFDADTRLGIGVAKDNPDLKARLEAALKDMNRDGTYTALMAKWGLPATGSVF